MVYKRKAAAEGQQQDQQEEQQHQTLPPDTEEKTQAAHAPAGRRPSSSNNSNARHHNNTSRRGNGLGCLLMLILSLVLCSIGLFYSLNHLDSALRTQTDFHLSDYWFFSPAREELRCRAPRNIREKVQEGNSVMYRYVHHSFIARFGRYSHKFSWNKKP